MFSVELPVDLLPVDLMLKALETASHTSLTEVENRVLRKRLGDIAELEAMCITDGYKPSPGELAMMDQRPRIERAMKIQSARDSGIIDIDLLTMH